MVVILYQIVQINRFQALYVLGTEGNMVICLVINFVDLQLPSKQNCVMRIMFFVQKMVTNPTMSCSTSYIFFLRTKCKVL